MNKWVRLFIMVAVAAGLLFSLKTAPVAASPGLTSACESCHAYPSTSLRVTTDITSTTVGPGQSFPVNISWSGADNGRLLEINWPSVQSNALFNPTPRIPYSNTAGSGTTTSTLTAPATPGTYTVRVYAARRQPTRDTYYANITVTVTQTQTNVAPVLSAIGNKSVTAGQLLQFTVSATDANGDALTYSASNLPSGASFNTSTHTFAWTPASSQAGTYNNVVFQVSDGSLTDSEAITITVTTANVAPVLSAIGNRSVTAGQLLQFTVSATDANGDALVYTASNLPSGASFNTSTHTFAWTPTSAGTYTNVTFQVSDGSLSASETITITVTAAANSPPVLNLIGDKLVNAEHLLSFTISATDADGDTLTYAASNLPSGASCDTSTRVFAWAPQENEIGVYSNVVFQVSDGLFTDSEIITITVMENPANVAPVLAPIGDKSVTAGQLLQFTVQATDANSNALTYSVSNLPSGASFNTSTHTFAWTPTSAGTYSNVGFQVSDGSLTDSEAITITVTAANVAPVFSAIGNKSVTAGQLLQFTVSATDANGDALAYSASNLPSGASFDATTRTFAWTPSSSQAGTYVNVGFQVSDGLLTTSEAITVTVTAANVAPVFSAIGNKSAAVGQALQFTVSATDANGDALTYSAANLPSGASFDATTRTFAWTPASSQMGTYTNVNFQASDGLLSASEAITITVTGANVAPVFAEVGNKSVITGQLLQFVVSATDANGDALVYSASNLPSGATFDATTHTFVWTPTSSHAGIYNNVTFQVSDGTLAASGAIAITVTRVNVAPVLSAIGSKSVTAGQALQFNVSATDANGDALVYSASNLPSGASFDATTHAFAWTPTSSQAGIYNSVHFEVSDGIATASENIAITVSGTHSASPVPLTNVAPVMSPIGDRQVTAGEALQFMVLAGDANYDSLTYYATNLPSGATFNAVTRTFFWRPSAGQLGTYPGIRFAASDGTFTSSEDITIVVVGRDAIAPSVDTVIAPETTPDSAIIHWTTDEPSTSQVEYWASPSKFTPLDEDLVTDHTVLLTGLKPGISYTYKTRSVDRSGNLSESDEQTFKTPPAFSVSGLTVTPAEARIGEEVKINVMVTNHTNSRGTYGLALRVGDAQESAATLSLAAGEQRLVSFTTARYTGGSFPVEVNGATGYLTVRSPAAEASGKLPAGMMAIGVGLPLIGATIAFWRWRRRPRSGFIK